jgi:hypothetical protein
MDLIHDLITIIISVFLLIGAFIIYNNFVIDKKIEKKVKKKCQDCIYKKDYAINEKLNKQMENAIVVIDDIYEIIESDFNSICTEKLTLEKPEDLFKSDVYDRFLNIWNDIKNLLIDLIRTQYKANNFAGLKATDIISRVSNFWDIVYTSYDMNFKIVPPSIGTITDILKNNKQEIILKFKTLYSKEVYEI